MGRPDDGQAILARFGVTLSLDAMPGGRSREIGRAFLVAPIIQGCFLTWSLVNRFLGST